MILQEKHINKKKPDVDDIIGLRRDLRHDDDEWSHIVKSVGEKIDSGDDVMEIQDRSITFNDGNYVKTKEEIYRDKSDDFKDRFGNTAQYLKFVNAHLIEKKNYLDKILTEKDRFDNDIAVLNPNQTTKEQLDKLDYNKVKTGDIKIVLKHIQDERDLIKEKIEHFTRQISQANEELSNKNKQIDEIKTELTYVETIENSNKSKIEKEDDVVGAIQKELKSLAPNNESEKIFGAINSLVVLLNSKNQSTLNELNAVKNEFKKMKQEYDKVMDNFEQKK